MPKLRSNQARHGMFQVGLVEAGSAWFWSRQCTITHLIPARPTGAPGCPAGTGEGRRLLKRAQQAGTVRKDVSLEDLLCVVTAISLAVEQGNSPKSRVPHLIGLFLGGIGIR